MRYTSAQRILRITVFAALLAAISIVCGKYLAFNVGEFIRFSFENLPILFAGLAFGPLTAALVAVVADLLGCLLVGYAINPIITVAAGVIGVVCGIFRYIPFGNGRFALLIRIACAVAASHLIGSVIIKSFGLSVFYDMPLIILMLWRLLNYVIVGAVEGLLLYFLMKNKRLVSELGRLTQRK